MTTVLLRFNGEGEGKKKSVKVRNFVKEKLKAADGRVRKGNFHGIC